MYLMYVDESGDPGKVHSPTRYYILSAMVVHETIWKQLIDDLIQFRRVLKLRYGLLLKDEIHASHFISGRAALSIPISRNDRYDILKKCIDWLGTRNDVRVFTVRIDKNSCTDPFETAWTYLIQRFDNTLAHRNFPGPSNGLDTGMILCDDTDTKLTRLLRAMRRYNPIPNMQSIHGSGYRDMPLRIIVEDPVFRNSKHSFLLQLTDVVAYFAKLHYQPNSFVRRKGGKDYYGRLANVINQHVTKRSSFYKIVEQ